MGRKFLCCLPVRLGTFLISVFQGFLSIAWAVILWIVIIRSQEHNENDSEWKRIRVVTILVAIENSLIGLCCVFGFFGTLAKKKSMIRIFSTGMSWLLGFTLGLSIIQIVLFFIYSSGSTDRCVSDNVNKISDKDELRDTCEKAVILVKTLVVVFPCLLLLLQAYAIYVINGYYDKLVRHENKKHGLPLAGGHYSKVKEGDIESQPFVAPPVTYPYADAAHSHGHVHS